MADALKAEGNKAFAAKNFDEAVYAVLLLVFDSQSSHQTVSNSHKPSSLSQRTMFCILTDLVHMPH